MNPKMECVNSSQSSHRDARGIDDRQSLIKAIQKTRDEYQKAGFRLREIETQLAELNAKIKGRILPQGIYRDLCEQQLAAKQEKLNVEKQLTELKNTMAALKQDKKLFDNAEELTGIDRVCSLLNTIANEIRMLRKELKKERS